MDKALTELKIKSKKLLKAIQQQGSVGTLYTKLMSKHKQKLGADAKLTQCQHLVALSFGFDNWLDAKHVLTGAANTGSKPNMGTLWNGPECDGYINQWFVDYDEASSYVRKQANMYLLPYKQQYFVVHETCLDALGLYADCQALWATMGNDLISAYGSPEWDTLACKRLRSS